ncbi:hypothetical protein CRUP_002457 [Coryphaenoides rupestris]|nr:hypothetical protein CRUP_002457 [Coryphaenoides rupestris]
MPGCLFLGIGVAVCWETRVGQEMYKLTVFDFIIIAAVTIFVEFPRKLMVNYCQCGLMKWLGQQEFAIPQNVLEIVYGQTICWIGTFYCPLLPAICTIKYFFIFYIKKVSLVNNCRPATRPFRASSSNFFFLVVLLIGLALACLPVTVGIARINCSQACGPFVNFTTTWEVLPRAVSELPEGIQTIFLALGSEAFAEGRDKRFLILKLDQAQKPSTTRSPVSQPQQPRSSRGSSSSPSYHTSFNSNYNDAMFLAHPPPHSSTHV